MDNDDRQHHDEMRNSSNEKKKKKKKRQSASREVAQLERDVQAKSLSGPAVATSPGAISTNTHGNVEPGTTGRNSRRSSDSRDASAAIRSLEQDVQAKNRARPGAASATGGTQAGTKGSGRSLQNSNNARMEARTLAEQQAGLLSLEEDLQAKNQARGGGGGGTPLMLDPPQRKASPNADNKQVPAGLGVAAGIPHYQASPQEGGGNKDFFDEFDADKRPSDENGGSNPFTADVNQQGSPPEEAPVAAQVGGSGNSEDENQGLMAELAPNQVIAPLDLQVIKSHEEEEQEEKARFRRYLIWGFVGLLAVSAAVVIPVVLIFGKPSGPTEPTMAPSLAPTGAPSFAPSTSRRQDILQWAETISDPADLANITSPQFRAAAWVADEDELRAEQDNGVQLLQRYVLAVYYFSTGGDEWEECFRNDACVVGFSWLTGSRSECLWHGVRCTTDGKVQKILIGNQAPLGNNQVGTLPSELAELTDITSLVMLRGKISGTIPTEFGRFTKIDSIFIQEQLLTGGVPQELIQNCRELQMLAFGDNYLNGTIPTTIAMLPKLLDLQLWGNRFTGTIPTEFGTVIDSIRILELQYNLLGGNIPLTLFNNVNLTTLSLDNNELAGTIPEDLGRLTILRTLEVGGNQLVGNLPESIYTMPALQKIRIEDTGLGGVLSERLSELNATLGEFNAANTGYAGSLPLALSQLTRLNFLYLHGTQMTGTVPFTLCTAGLVNLTMPAAVDCSLTASCCTVQA